MCVKRFTEDLIPSVVKRRSFKKLSVLACWTLARSSSNAMKQMQVKIMMRASILRMSLCSSPQVHLDRGLNLCKFSLEQNQYAWVRRSKHPTNLIVADTVSLFRGCRRRLAIVISCMELDMR